MAGIAENALKFMETSRNGLKWDGHITVFRDLGIRGYWDLNIGDWGISNCVLHDQVFWSNSVLLREQSGKVSSP